MKSLASILVLLFTVPLLAELPTIENTEHGIIQHLKSYNGLEFSVTSSFYKETSTGKEIVSLSKIHETIRLHFPEKGPAWKYWTQEIQDKFDRQWIVNCFKVTNVVETRNFIYIPEVEGKWNHGDVIPWHQWDEDEGRCFFTFLGLDTIGLSLFAFNVTDNIRDDFIKQNNLRFVQECHFENQKAWEFQGNNGELKYKVCVLYPQNMVVHCEFSDNQTSMLYTVEKVGVFEGIFYPQKGQFRQSPLGLIDKVDYNFEVTDICRYNSELLSNWFPAWPTGTSMRDLKTEKVTRVPPSERQLKKVAEQWNSHEITPRSPMWLVIRVTLITAGLVLILYALYRMRQGK